MKTSIKTLAIWLLLLTTACSSPQNTTAQYQGSVSFQVFYDELSPYGTWVNNPQYGYVWMPDVSSGFIPYSTNGYWVMTEDGWTWVSNYSWGWAPFHYGRWYMDDYYGPMWVPDNEWGPGWVTWRRSAGYYGWAPIGPGINIDFAYSNNYDLPFNRWTFVRDRDFGRTNIYNYYINNSNNVTIINNSTVINNTRTDRNHNVRFNGGPDRNEVEQRAGKTFTPIAIKDDNRPGQRINNKELQIYRPQLQRNNSGDQKPVPKKVENITNVRPPSQRTADNPKQLINPNIKTQPDTRQTPQLPRNDQRTKELPTPLPPQKDKQPVRQEPVNQLPRTQPTKQIPNDQPRQQPVKQQPTPVPPQKDKQPVRQEPVNQLPRTQPTKQIPNVPPRQQPVKQQPQQPVRQQPTMPPRQSTQPIKQQPQQQNTPPNKKKNKDN